MSEICRRYRVKGRVQGVFFRETTKRQAIALGLTGHAVNCADGSVQVLACGSQEQVQQLADWLWQGPAMARVNRPSLFGPSSTYSVAPVLFTPVLFFRYLLVIWDSLALTEV